MILLIKLFKVIALHVTRALASAINDINGLFHTLQDFWYQHFHLSSKGLKPSSVPCTV